MNKKNLILASVLAILFTSILIIFSPNSQKLSLSSPTPSPIFTESISPTPDPTADWKTYTNSQYGFLFQYPSNWIINEKNSGAKSLISNNKFIQMVEVSNSSNKISIYYEGDWDHGFEPWTVSSTDNIFIDNKPTKKTIFKNSGNSSSWILYTIDNFHDFRIEAQVDGEKEISQILSTFKFTNTVPTLTPTVSINKVKILDTSSWVEYSCGSISYKLPANYTQRCTENSDGTQDVLYSESGKYFSNSISIRKYDGGSRRQFWIDTMHATPSEVSKYVRFQESLFGTVSGLDVFASGGWWQGGYASPILIAHDKTIVYIFGGRDFNEVAGKITRWDISDTIASTIKFNN